MNISIPREIPANLETGATDRNEGGWVGWGEAEAMNPARDSLARREIDPQGGPEVRRQTEGGLFTFARSQLLGR